MNTMIETKAPQVTGLLYKDLNGSAKVRPAKFETLEELYGFLLEDVDFLNDREPFAIQFAERPELPFNGTLFHYAFAKGRISESQLLDMLQLTKAYGQS